MIALKVNATRLKTMRIHQNQFEVSMSQTTTFHAIIIDYNDEQRNSLGQWSHEKPVYPFSVICG